jgi:hypothetical protein
MYVAGGTHFQSPVMVNGRAGILQWYVIVRGGSGIAESVIIRKR